MALQGTGPLPTSYPPDGGVGHVGLPGRLPYAAGEEDTIRHPLPRSHQQRRGEPCLAQGEEDWEAWRRRLAEEGIVHLLLNGKMVKTQLDKKTNAGLGAGGLGRVTGRVEGPLGGSGHGRGEHDDSASFP